MDDLSKEKSEYNNNIYNRLQKNISRFDWYLIHKKQYFFDNIFFYFLCIIFRFIPLIILSGDFYSLFEYSGTNNSFQFQEFLKKLTCHNLIKNLYLSDKKYYKIFIFLIILLICRIIIIYFIVENIQKYKSIKELSFLNKYIIIIEHIIFLLFPYILEFLSFPYYIFFFTNKFVIKLEDEYNLLFIFMPLSAILIIIYNLNNYISIMCSNRMNSISIFDAYFNIITGKNIKPVAYRTSNLSLYIFTFLQNLSIFLHIQYYSYNQNFLLLFNIIFSIIMILAIFILILIRVKTFNYNNFINSFINIIKE